MAIITTDSQNYADIAAAIRDKNGSETQYKPNEMAAAIAAISGGGSGGGGDYEIDIVRYSVTNLQQMNNFNFTDYEYIFLYPAMNATISAIMGFKVPEVGVWIDYQPALQFNGSYATFDWYNNASYPLKYRLTNETTLQVSLFNNKGQALSAQQIFGSQGTNKAAVFGMKKPTTASMFKARKRTPANIIREPDNSVPLIVNEQMTEQEILTLFHVLEPTERNDNIYIVNNPIVTPELVNVVQEKGYNVIQ